MARRVARRMRAMDGGRLSRRELLVVGAAAGLGIGLRRSAIARAREPWSGGLGFGALPAGGGWAGWVGPGGAELRRGGGRGVRGGGGARGPGGPPAGRGLPPPAVP